MKKKKIIISIVSLILIIIVIMFFMIQYFICKKDIDDIETIKISKSGYLLSTCICEIDFSNNSFIYETEDYNEVVTENVMAVEALTKNKTAKNLVNWQALKSSINKDLDPAVLYNTVIVTNHDGFDYLDSTLNTNSRPILQPDIINPTVK